MRYIRKGPPPPCFTKAVEGFDARTSWREFQNPGKRQTAVHILEQEQLHLCAYCEIGISADNQPVEYHLEHIQPQSTCPNCRFDYRNLVASCNANLWCDNVESEDSCGHRKNNEYDPAQFLSPVDKPDISDFFAFDKNNGGMMPDPRRSPNDRERAGYTLKTLNLDNPRLNKYRLDALTALEKELTPLLEREGAAGVRRRLPKILSLEGPRLMGFITFLRWCFRNQLERSASAP